ncbi:MAG: hypothetical protein QCH35_09450 [Methanomicrobiaceae archaeon]|nr:hypothetical protein [Methanomicrobiaceae archaeon]
MEPPSHMPRGEGQVLSAIQQKQIMRACDHRCECCRQQFQRYILEIHAIGEDTTANSQGCDIDERHVIVMCARCWHSTKNLPGSNAILQSIAVERAPEIRAQIQRILAKKPTPYMPETEFDLAELFADAYDTNGMDLFLNGM